MFVKAVAPSGADQRDRVQGLLGYLYGPGRREEHTDPHVVAGSERMQLGDAVSASPRGLAAQLAAPHRLFGTETGSERVVYHLPISLAPEDPELSDEQWAYIARRAVHALGWDGADGRAGCRWVAVRHGMAHSPQGERDHIHLVIHRVAEDGTLVSRHNDHYALSRLRRELEDDPTLGLVAKTRSGTRGAAADYTQAEAVKARRAGAERPDRARLAETVRGCVAPAESEADWIRMMRGQGLLVRPRWAEGGRSAVVGYSVALPPPAGQEPVWFGGGKLAKDLTLTAVRRRWDGHDPAAAVESWSARAEAEQASGTGSRERPGGRLDRRVAETIEQAGVQYQQQLRQLPAGDTAGWAAVTRETSEMFAWAATHAAGQQRRELSRAAETLARAGQQPTAGGRGWVSPAGRGLQQGLRQAHRIITGDRAMAHGGWAAAAQLILQATELAQTIQQLRATQQHAQAWRETQAQQRLLAAATTAGHAAHQLHPQPLTPAQHAGRLVALQDTPRAAGQPHTGAHLPPTLAPRPGHDTGPGQTHDRD